MRHQNRMIRDIEAYLQSITDKRAKNGEYLTALINLVPFLKEVGCEFEATTVSQQFQKVECLTNGPQHIMTLSGPQVFDVQQVRFGDPIPDDQFFVPEDDDDDEHHQQEEGESMYLRMRISFTRMLPFDFINSQS